MKKSVKVDLSWRAWSLIVGFFILIGFVGLSFAVSIDPSIHGHPDQSMPAGFIGAFYLSSCPTGWILANGTDGTPDLRGAFIRGMYGDLNGRDVVRILGDYQVDKFKYHSHTAQSYPLDPSDVDSGIRDSGGGWWATLPVGTNSGFTGDLETRPKNIALLYCMKI